MRGFPAAEVAGETDAGRDVTREGRNGHVERAGRAEGVRAQRRDVAGGRDPGEGRTSGKVSFSTGTAIVGEKDKSEDVDPSRDDFTSYFYFFPVEGSLSLWLLENYDLTLSVGAPFVMGLEGNLSIAPSESVRVGIIHGMAFAFMGQFTGYEGDWSGEFLPDLSAGLFLQFSTAGIGTTFLGFKYSYGMYSQLGGPDDYQKDLSETHYISWAIGHSFTTGRLRITPEFMMCYGDWHWEYRDDDYPGEGDSDLYAFALSITFAAAY